MPERRPQASVGLQTYDSNRDANNPKSGSSNEKFPKNITRLPESTYVSKTLFGTGVVSKKRPPSPFRIVTRLERLGDDQVTQEISKRLAADVRLRLARPPLSDVSASG